ncbi:MAG: tyrosine-type recombinase/integrase, partial [Holosporales bacterium]|nr:tyrosine-type recombinase/integrase [Holosporales bacterium]
NLIMEYINDPKTPSSEFLFVNISGHRLSSSSIQKLIRKSRRFLGLSDRITPHSLRHSCATHLMEANGDLRSIQELFGHSSISSTQIYADVASRYIAEAYDKYHPLSHKKHS